jgi:hypothetical protein
MPKKPSSPPRHPPGDTPKITDEQRRSLSESKLRLREAEVLLEDRRRRERKRSWLSDENPPDRRDREHSLSYATSVAMPKEEELMRMGAAHSGAQSSRARHHRGPLNRLIDAVLCRDMAASAREVFDAIGNGQVNEPGILQAEWDDDEAISVSWFRASGGTQGKRVTEKQVTETVTFDKAFEVRVSRRRAALLKVT